MSLVALVMLALAAGPPEPDDDIVIGPPLEAPSSRAQVWARWTSHLAVELDRDGASRWLRLGSTLALGLDWAPGDGWQTTLEVRLRHRLDLVPDAPGDRFGDASITGAFSPELRRALVRWQGGCGPVLSLGMDIVRWGRTLARPFDLASPLDERDGALPPEGADRVPVFALALRQPVGEGELLALWLPFYFAAQLPPFTRQTSAPTQDLWHSSELAVRLTQRLAALDVALGWMLRFDRRPQLPSLSPLGPSEPGAPARQHALGLELALTTGPLRWALESALFLDQRHYATDLGAEARPTLRWAFDVASAPAVFLDLTVGLEGVHVAGAATPTWLEGPDDLWLRSRVGLMLAYDGVVRLDIEGRVGLSRDDWWLAPALTVRASAGLVLALGASVFGGDAMDLGLGALYDRADQLWLRVTWSL